MECMHKIFLKSIREKVDFFAFLMSCTLTITMEKVVRPPPGPKAETNLLNKDLIKNIYVFGLFKNDSCIVMVKVQLVK